ncbi:uncharacterized protein LOC130624287 isoform X2 [Hydractinia symbiolongicarpus]|uniref:uncharacterized protein LOC130624287 isoform X2 n=1 Tax=Hydractinia symbiolongicarpus TaxID=13093 RepID=UPI00255137CA|nr:uncharacterized protein LOC130624287 isoform X2 [Hydractinia symbiolongicarpus]
MRLVIFVGIVLCLHCVSSVWITELFSELNDGKDINENLRKGGELYDTVKDYAKKLEKEGLSSVQPVLEKTFEHVKKKWKNVNDVAVKNGLHYAEKYWKKNNKVTVKTVNKKKAYLIAQWNILLEKMNNADNKTDIKKLLHKFKRLSKKLSSILPKDLFSTMKLGASVMVEKVKQKAKDNKVKFVKLNLKKNLAKWAEPHFMQIGHNIRDSTAQQTFWENWNKKHFLKPRHKDYKSIVDKKTVNEPADPKTSTVAPKKKEEDVKYIVVDDAPKVSNADVKKKDLKIKKKEEKQRKFSSSGNKNWGLYRIHKVKAAAKKAAKQWVKKRLANKKFSEDLKKVEQIWFKMRKSLLG